METYNIAWRVTLNYLFINNIYLNILIRIFQVATKRCATLLMPCSVYTVFLWLPEYAVCEVAWNTELLKAFFKNCLLLWRPCTCSNDGVDMKSLIPIKTFENFLCVSSEHAKSTTDHNRQASVYFKYCLRMWYCGLTGGESNCWRSQASWWESWFSRICLAVLQFVCIIANKLENCISGFPCTLYIENTT